MALTIDEALALEPGTLLTFGKNDWTFEVVEVKPHPTGVEILLKRSDGYETFAHGYMLDVASVVKPAKEPVPSVPVQSEQPEPLVAPAPKKTSKG